MTAALTAYDRGAKPLLIEKSDRYGGSSAMSGGGVWVPNNHVMAGIGITDTPDDAWSYLKAATAGVVSDDRLHAYLEYAPVMPRYLVEQTRLRLVPLPVYADYCPTLPGCRPGGRSLEPERFDAAALGDEFDRLQEQNPQMLIMGRVFMTIVEARTLLGRTPGWARLSLKLLARYWGDVPWRLQSKRDRHLTMGNALVGMLRRSLMDRNVPQCRRRPENRASL